MYTEASYCLSQLITFCNSVFLDNLYVDVNSSGVHNRAGGGGEETTKTDSISPTASNIVESKTCNSRGLDYYMWVMTRLVTHVEVLLEKAAGAFWGENSKERSLLVNTYHSTAILVLTTLPVACWPFRWLWVLHCDVLIYQLAYNILSCLIMKRPAKLYFQLHEMQILTIESIKAINRLFALLSSSNGKHTMILNWSKVRTLNVILNITPLILRD